MATDQEIQREYLLERIVESLPRGYLEEVERRTQAAYRGKFADVKADPTTLEQHRLWKLIQDRMFRMDWELAEAAKAHGLPYTTKPLPDNKWAYTYVIAGTFGLTQAYVQTVGALPIPARYRDELAKAAGMPRLPLDDVAEIYKAKEFYGLFAHNPVGKQFTEDDQKLGTLQLCIPCKEMNGWAFEMSVPELLSYYPSKTEKPEKKRAPSWKRDPKRGTGTES